MPSILAMLELTLPLLVRVLEGASGLGETLWSFLPFSNLSNRPCFVARGSFVDGAHPPITAHDPPPCCWGWPSGAVAYPLSSQSLSVIVPRGQLVVNHVFCRVSVYYELPNGTSDC